MALERVRATVPGPAGRAFYRSTCQMTGGDMLGETVQVCVTLATLRCVMPYTLDFLVLPIVESGRVMLLDVLSYAVRGGISESMHAWVRAESTMVGNGSINIIQYPGGNAWVCRRRRYLRGGIVYIGLVYWHGAGRELGG